MFEVSNLSQAGQILFCCFVFIFGLFIPEPQAMTEGGIYLRILGFSPR